MKPDDERHRKGSAGHDMTAPDDLRTWLDAEAEDLEGLADSSFASLMSHLPAVEATPAFIQQTTALAWGVHTRRQRAARRSRVAVLLGVTAATLVGACAVGPWLIEGLARAVVVGVQALMWVAGTLGGGARWWALAAKTASAIAQPATSPQGIALLVGFELIGAAAMYGFHRMLGREIVEQQS